MFGIEALDVVIGMIFIYLLFSLFVTILNELLNSYLNVRGRELAKHIALLITDYDSAHTIDDKLKDFYQSKEIKNLTEPASWLLKFLNTIRSNRSGKLIKSIKDLRLPDEITPEKFKNACIERRISGGSNTSLVKDYNDAMYIASSKYKRKLSKILFGFGFLIAVFFNADSIDIFKALNDDPEIRARVVEQATEYLASHPDSIQFHSSTIELRNQIDSLRTIQIKEVNSVLSLGWNFDQAKIDSSDTKICEWYHQLDNQTTWRDLAGWLITALAISLGAPFWYDLLKKVINLKNELKK